MSTVIIGIIVAVIIFLAARDVYCSRKKGSSPCGGNCSCCCGCTAKKSSGENK